MYKVIWDNNTIKDLEIHFNLKQETCEHETEQHEYLETEEGFENADYCIKCNKYL